MNVYVMTDYYGTIMVFGSLKSASECLPDECQWVIIDERIVQNPTPKQIRKAVNDRDWISFYECREDAASLQNPTTLTKRHVN